MEEWKTIEGYDGRYEGPYEAFSYFYYPPNILDDIGLDELKDKVWIKPGVLGSKETKQMYEKMFNCKINIPEKKPRMMALSLCHL